MSEVEERRIKLWQDKIETDVEVSGKGSPVIYLHGPWGLAGDRGFIASLAETHKVFAPKHPGTSRGAPNAVQALDDWWDLIVYHGELMDRLGLDRAAFAGHSFGGLVAAEIAAAMPSRVARLALIDPVGLWRDDKPVRNWMILPDAERAKTLFADPDGAAAARFFGLPNEPKARLEAQVSFVWSQAATGKFVWPLPDRGLKRRIHRIAAPTLILWGRDDGVIDASYAQDFARGIAGARVELIDRAGHLPHLEAAERVLPLIRKFLDV